jgi:hypothetical protein
MEEQIKKAKTSLRISAIVVIVTCTSLVISHRLDTIRTVDFIQIFVGGAAFGILMANAFLLKRLKAEN